MSTQDDDESIHSTFSDGDGSNSIDLRKLELAVGEILGIQCALRKLTEGGNHKIYDIILAGTEDIKYLLRVPSPDFQVDKLSSEVATLQYIAANTSVPVPKVLAWNSDPANSAGTEYMILEKIPGVSANLVWDVLEKAAKERLVHDVAIHLISLFNLRFSLAGSLFSPQGTVLVGPLVTTPFFHLLDGEARFPHSAPLDLTKFRGPFTRTTDLLSSSPKAELHVIKHRRSELLLQEFNGDEALLELGERVLEKVVQLIQVYPGELAIGPSSSSGDDALPFSMKLNDFRLENIMVDERSGQVLGLIDFEETTTAPLWMCAGFPFWIDHHEADEKPEDEELAHLRGIFRETVKAQGKIGEDWLTATEKGALFRDFALMLDWHVQIWASPSMEQWVDERLAFAKKHPGVGMPEKKLAELIEEQYGSRGS